MAARAPIDARNTDGDTALHLALAGAHSAMTESLLAAAAGGILGSFVAFWGVKLLLTISPESLARARNRLPTFKHAMSSTKPDAPMRMKTAAVD